MTHFNLNRMLQGCSAFIQTMAGDRAARNDAKRVNNHVLPLTCPLLASSLRLTRPLQLRRIALILCVLVMNMANIGTAWGGTITWDFGSESSTFTHGTNKSFTGSDGKTTITWVKPDKESFDGTAPNKYLKIGRCSGSKFVHL